MFSQFRRQFEISLPFIMRGSREKSGKTSRNERRRRLEWQPRLSGCYKQGSTQRPYNIRKHKTHTDVLNRSLLFLFFIFFFVFVLLHFCGIFLWFRVSGRRVPLVMAKVRSRSRGTHTSNSDTTTTSPGNNQLRGRMKEENEPMNYSNGSLMTVDGFENGTTKK